MTKPPRWDPEHYLRFADERARPFHDLLARVPVTTPAYVVDLGCGPGGLTRLLAERWPAAEVEGVDASEEMVAQAHPRALEGRLSFTVCDLRSWAPRRPVDVLVTNATLQWVPRHLELLPRLVSWLAPGGWLALQVPANFAEPGHRLLRDLQDDPRWRATVADVERPSSHDPAVYLEALATLGCAVDAWETTYLHVLTGPDPVLHWMTGTGARPTLRVLPEAQRPAFLEAYGERLRAAYRPGPAGTVLPYRRVFVVARRSETTAP